MRCPYCRHEIHDQALKCPHCQRLLVPKPGWQRRRPPEERSFGRAGGSARRSSVRQAADEGAYRFDPPRGFGAGDGRPPAGTSRPPRGGVSGRVLLFLAMVLFMAAAGLVGYVVGRTTTEPPEPSTPTVEAETIAQLEAVAEQRLREVRRLRERLASTPTPTPPQRRLLAALSFCDRAFTFLIDREEAVFADRAALVRLIQLSNRCLAPIGREIRIP